MTSTPVVLSVAFPFAPVGPLAVGGAEVLLSQIEAALPALGFRSVVVAHAGSRPGGQLYPVDVPHGEITDEVRRGVELSMQTAIDRACAEHPIALVHMHGLDFARYRIPDAVPVLATLHLPPEWYPSVIWDLPSQYTFVCVSETQRRRCPPRHHGRLQVITNGVPLPEGSTLRPGGRYALMLARICPEKNLHTGLDAARLAGMPAVLAGDVFPYADHLRYFANEIEPRLTRRGSGHEERSETAHAQPEARFLGPVTGAAKDRLIARAACLLLPSLAPETSSLVAMEALAAGVPVIAMASGAVPEIVEEGRTGFLVTPGNGPAAAQALADALRRLPELDRRLCRSVAVRRFSLHHTLASYGELYRQLAPESSPSELSLGPTPEPLPAQPQSFRIAHLTSEADLDTLVPAWTELWQRDPQATPFQHPAWLRPWWRQFGPDGDLHTFPVYTGTTGELAGLLPLYIYSEPATGQRKLLLLGAGTTDYLDGLWSPAYPGAAAAALHHVRAQLAGWDAAYLPQIRPGSPLIAAGKALHLATTLSETTAVVGLATALPAKLRANLRRYHRRAAAIGPLTCEAAGDLQAALRNFDHLLRFHAERWGDKDEEGVLSDPRVQQHHREALPLLGEAGLLRFFRLTLGGEILGVLYAFADPPQRTERSLYLYLIGFSKSFAELSPGSLLLHHVWEYARVGGFSKLDLLRGGEEYKRLWGATPQPTSALEFSPASTSEAAPA